jgi:hypothetical protein
MAAGSLSLWTVVPVGWLWLASNLVRSNLFSYLFALVACPVSMVQGAKGLYLLQERYDRVRAIERPATPTGWLRSLSAERRSLRGLSALDWMMVLSVLAALVAWTLYYFVLSHPSVVTGPEAPGDEHDLGS